VRFLFCTRPFYGHFHVMAGLARAVQAVGHHVAFATAASFGSVVERSGFSFMPAGLDPRDPSWDGPGHSPADRDWGEAVVHSKVADLLALVPAWRPDVVVREQTDFGGLLAAEASGVPAATLGPAMFIPASSWQRLIGDKLDRIRRDLALPLDPAWERTHAYLYLDPVPPWYQLPAASTVPVRHQIRPGLFDGSESSSRPTWLDTLPSRPTVYVTLGTVFNRRPSLFRTILAALGPLPVNVICTIGPDQDGAGLGRVPDNVRIESFVPQSQLLLGCDLVVSHGGFSTVMGSLAHGLPMLIIPLGSDNLVHARRCASLGVAWSISPQGLTGDEVRAAVCRLLEEPRWRLEAERRRDDIAALPDMHRGVDLLVQLALVRQPLHGGE
jgi:UDP:flavonoid glycosyltransferase YjiC (YdhE family)